jgi:hypothetical protein
VCADYPDRPPPKGLMSHEEDSMPSRKLEKLALWEEA